MLRTVLLRTARIPWNHVHLGTSCQYRSEVRRNSVGIQLLPDPIRAKVFNSSHECNPVAPDKVRQHLETHNLWDRQPDLLDDVSLDLSEVLVGADVEQYFKELGETYIAPYREALNRLVSSELPPVPKKFAFQEGWVRYNGSSQPERVPAPEGNAIVFDVETIVIEGGLPAMAAALSDKHWYTWCSSALVKGKDHRVERVTPDVLIPLGSGSPEQVVIGHHVGFDRSFVKEEYGNSCPMRRFLDTLSMHVCVSGQASEQRMLYLKRKKAQLTETKKKRIRVPAWESVSAPNGLADVYRLYCGGELSKSERDTFTKGTSDDVRQDFQKLMEYCVNDVKATSDVFKKLFPLFLHRLPHSITLFGIMEMLTAYLPVNQNWTRYINQAEAVYEDVNTECRLILNMIANRACRMSEGETWKHDPWLWDLDWKTQNTTSRRCSTQRKRPFMSGYPKWYRDLCIAKAKDLPETTDYEFGAWKISTQMRYVPKLMKLMWNGYPLHHNDKLGWGYLVPFEGAEGSVPATGGNRLEGSSIENPTSAASATTTENNADSKPEFPLDAYRKIIASTRKKHIQMETGNQDNGQLDPHNIGAEIDETREMEGSFTSKPRDGRRKSKKIYISGVASTNDQPDLHDIGISGIRFRKLPHKNGPKYNVGNPLSKDFISQFEGNVLTSWDDDNADTLLRLGKQATYWKNARDRLKEQMVVWIGKEQGVILPRLMPAGTISRRAVEKTWLTASNAKKDRIGSELKAMIQAPEGMHFVGADVDSQELWIASLLGDSHFEKIHGCTAFGWMTLQGTKADGTDMHSRTAAAAGCSRDHAKVLNYARIYGAGERFSATLLKRFNPSLTEAEAAARARKMFESTKGKRSYGASSRWSGGTESHMFNKLEEMAESSETKTPVLGAQITRALQADNVDHRYMTSRINWIVQSSAVDYLHLMLASMRHLCDKFDIGGRLVVSIHDEVRFLVPSDNRYRASLALHITNLLVRALFAKQLDMEDLPFGVAFFSAVDVDRAIRKSVTDDSVTPSNLHGLHKNYGIPPGEELDIYKTLERTNGGKLHK